MCIEDAVLSRLTWTKTTPIAAGGSVTIGRNPDRLLLRVSIQFAAAGALSVFLTPDDQASNRPILVLQGDTVPTATDVVGKTEGYITYEKDLRLVCESFIITVTNVNAIVVEEIMKPSLAKIVARRMQEIQDAYPSVSPTQPSPVESVY